MGDTSGINIMNPNATAVTANVYWVNPSGFQADNFGTSSVTIPGFANGFVYTLWQHNLPNGFMGAAQVVASAPVAAVSANVNYEVDGDGSAIFNAFNPCGFFRVAGECSFGDPFAPGGQSVTKTFIVDDGDGEDETEIGDAEGIAGVDFSIVSTSEAFPFQRDGVSGTDGSATFSNIPVGTYELIVNDVPADFLVPTNPADQFVVTEGTDVTLINELELGQGFEKTVCVADFDEEAYEEAVEEGAEVEEVDINDFITCSDVGLVGVQVVVFEVIGLDVELFPVVDLDPVFVGETGADGTVAGDLPSGDYILCLYAGSGPDSEITTTNGEVVEVDLFPMVPNLIPCIVEDGPDDGLEPDAGDYFTVESGIVTELENELLIEEGILNVFVFTEQVPVAGVELCIDGPIDGNFENDIDGCAITGEDGTARFPGAPAGNYNLTVDSGDMLLVVETAEGGLLTVDVNTVTMTEVNFDYSPTEDVVQDGVMDDVAGEGTFDLEIGMEGVGSLVKYVCDETNTVTDGCQAAQNEIQEITPFLPAPFIDCQGFTISFGDPPNNTAFFGSNCEATPAELEAGMIAQIDALVAGDIMVSGGPLYGAVTAPVLVEFTGNYALQDVPLLQVSASGTGGGGDVSTIQEAAVSAVVPGGTVQVFVALAGSDLADNTTWGPEVTAGPQPTDADGRFELAGLGEGTYIVCADAPTAAAEVCEFAEIVEGEETLLVNNIDVLGSMDVVNEEQNEIQSITTNALTNAEFALVFEGEVTDPIGGRESAAVVQAALEANANIGAGNVSCTGSLNFGGTVTCEFIGGLAGQDFDQMTFFIVPPNATSTIETIQDGGPTATISADAYVSGGTFTLTFAAETTAPIDWDASAAEVQAALEALSTVGAGNVSVSGGDLPGADIVVVFTGTLAGTAEDLTIDDSNIT